jgi:hypothetical protein
MANAAWETTHEEEAEASRDFAWRWDRCRKLGRLASKIRAGWAACGGSRGLTRLPRQEPDRLDHSIAPE